MGSIANAACLQLLLLLFVSGFAVSHSIVKTLPGFPGELPFKLETGYVSVGGVGLNGFFYQTGPLKFNISDYTGGLPTLMYEPNAWTKTANIIFLDLPVGVGFSYATTKEAWKASDSIAARQADEFLRSWLGNHPDFITNPVYLASDSYAGVVTPPLAQNIINGNEAGIEPRVNLKGFLLGCPHTNTDLEANAKIDTKHRMALISDAMYEAARTSCHGNYVNPTNANCTEALSAITQCTELINEQSILEPKCATLSPKASEEIARRSLKKNSDNLIPPWPGTGDFWCKNFEYLLSDIWTNYRSVQDALHVRPGTAKEFFRCNLTLRTTVYEYDITDAVPYHKNLIESGLQILVFSGDHDLLMPHLAIEQWIASLELTLDTDWRPWFVDGQVAGYTMKYTNNGYRLTYNCEGSWTLAT